MLNSIRETIQALETLLAEGKSCHDLPPAAADIEMLQTLERLGCTEPSRCTHPACPNQRALIEDCIGRWKQREAGVLTESDRVLVAFYLMKQFM